MLCDYLRGCAPCGSGARLRPQLRGCAPCGSGQGAVLYCGATVGCLFTGCWRASVAHAPLSCIVGCKHSRVGGRRSAFSLRSCPPAILFPPLAGTVAIRVSYASIVCFSAGGLVLRTDSPRAGLRPALRRGVGREKREATLFFLGGESSNNGPTAFFFSRRASLVA